MSNRVNGKEHRKGRSTRELHSAIPMILDIPVKQNDRQDRVNMYADFVARGEEIPYHLANNQLALGQYPNEVLTYAPVEEIVESDLEVLESMMQEMSDAVQA